MVERMKILTLYNPRAGHGKAGRLLPEVRSIANDLHLDLEVILTQHPRHTVEVLSAADLSAYDGVIGAGGDGSLFETINGLMKNPAGPSVPLAALPVGTGNSFSRDLGLKTGGVREALSAVASRRTRRVDVGKVTGPEATFYYLNILGLGFVSDVTVTAARLKLFGGLSYTLGVLHRLAGLRTHELRIKLDDLEFDREVIFVEVSNSRYTADYLMAPNARIDDGLLDVTVVRPVPRLRLLRLFPLVFSGEHVHLDEVETFQARCIRIESDGPLPLAPDGELEGTTPITIECQRQAVEMFARAGA